MGLITTLNTWLLSGRRPQALELLHWISASTLSRSLYTPDIFHHLLNRLTVLLPRGIVVFVKSPSIYKQPHKLLNYYIGSQLHLLVACSTRRASSTIPLTGFGKDLASAKGSRSQVSQLLSGRRSQALELLQLISAPSLGRSLALQTGNLPPLIEHAFAVMLSVLEVTSPLLSGRRPHVLGLLH